MQSYTFRLAQNTDQANIVQFMNEFWGEKHPLINIPDFFEYYYRNPDNSLRFVLAFAENEIAALAGYIPANQNTIPDIWVSIWVANPAHKGIGLELMAELPNLIHCRTIACNNIRPKTRAFYEFLGYTTGRISHFYRLAEKEYYQIAKIENKVIPPITGNATLQKIETPQALQTSSFTLPKNNPDKDFWYIKRRYFAYPHQKYDVWLVTTHTKKQALLVTRTTAVATSSVIRIVDYIGNPQDLPTMGNAINNLLIQQNAEYIDCYCVGIPPHIFKQAGFCERYEHDENIIPNYLTPPLIENIDFYYFTNNPNNFTLFKADGDQDRPNITV